MQVSIPVPPDPEMVYLGIQLPAEAPQLVLIELAFADLGGFEI